MPLRVCLFAALSAVLLNSIVLSEDADAVVAETEFVTRPSGLQKSMLKESESIDTLINSVQKSVVTGAKARREASDKSMGFLSEIKPKCDKDGDCTCSLDAERCFVSPSHRFATSCEKAMEKCRILKKGGYDHHVLDACNADAKKKCDVSIPHTDFHASYAELCADEINVKKEKNEKEATNKAKVREQQAKVEKRAKAAVEGQAKIKRKEVDTKKESEAQIKVLTKELRDTQAQEAELSLHAKESSSKQAKKANEVEAKMFKKEQEEKALVFKKNKESKSKCEAKIKNLNERMYKKQTISVTQQKEIYGKWSIHFSVEKDAKKKESLGKKSNEELHKKEKVEKKSESLQKEVTEKKLYTIEKISKAKPAAPAESLDACGTTTGGTCKGGGCAFPFNWQGVEHYKCITDKKHDRPFCLGAGGCVGYCRPGCTGGVKNKKHKNPLKKKTVDASNVVKKIVKAQVKHAEDKLAKKALHKAETPKPVPTPVVPLKHLKRDLKAQADEKEFKVLKEKLWKANEKNDKAANASTEKKAKCALKVEIAKRKKKTKAIKHADGEKDYDAESAKKVELKQKKDVVKEAATKFAEAALEKKSKEKVHELKKESLHKVLEVEADEASAKAASKEKRSKNPFIDLKSYCKKLHKMESMLIDSKEVDGKKYAALLKKSTKTEAELVSKKMKYKSEVRKTSCVETKEVCRKIKTTSELRQKEAIKVGGERKSKMEDKCALIREVDAAEQKKMRMAVCEAAHIEMHALVKFMRHGQDKLEGGLKLPSQK